MCLPLLAAAIPLVAGAASAAGGVAGIAGAATAGIGALSTVANYFGTQSAHHSAVQAANLNYNQKAEQVARANVQLGEQQSEQNLTDAVKAAQDFGMIANSASSMGLGEYSSHAALSADAAAYNRTLGITDRNYANKRADLGVELRGASIERSSAIASAPRANLGSLALGLLGNAAQGLTTYGQLGGTFRIKPAGGAPA